MPGRVKLRAPSPRGSRPTSRRVMPTWFITGSSSGLGRDLARAVLEARHNAVITARNPDSVKDLADAHPDTTLAVALDVTDPAQVAEAVRLGQQRFGGIDV